MTLSEFIEASEITYDGVEHHVTFEIIGSEKRVGVYVKGASNDFEAYEQAFLWLKELIENS